MSGLAERVREKIRGRSRSRSRSKRYSREIDEPVPEMPQRTSQNYTDGGPSAVTSPTSSAWHVHSGSRTSRDMHDPSAVSRPATGQYENGEMPGSFNDSQTQQSHRHQRNAPSDSLPPRTTSLPQGTEYNDQRQMNTSGGDAPQYPYTVPRRKESLQQNRVSQRMSGERRRSPEQQKDMGREPQYDQNGTVRSSYPSGIGNTRGSIDLPSDQMGGSLGTEINQALASLHVSNSVTNGGTRQGNPVDITNHKSVEGYEHVRVPQGFDLGNTERTIIDTQWKPAVTHEKIHHQRTEIIREAITRDIHVHHYYTYVQPIKVVEILPARHYIIDEHTGRKVEIEAPLGWVMPQDLTPRVADTSNVKGWSRHYLVNEQYPNGIAEPDPQVVPRKPISSHGHPEANNGEYVR